MTRHHHNQKLQDVSALSTNKRRKVCLMAYHASHQRNRENAKGTSEGLAELRILGFSEIKKVKNNNKTFI